MAYQNASSKRNAGSKYIDDANAIGGGSTFGVASLLLVVTLIAVCLGLFVVAPGIGMLLGVFSIPPLIRTLMVVKRKKAQGIMVDAGNKVALFLASFGVTVIITCVTLGLATVVFLGSCFSLALVAEKVGLEPDIKIIPASLFILFCVIAIIWPFLYWIRVRWRRDTKLP